MEEPHFAQEYQSRAGDIPPISAPYFEREALQRSPGGLHNWPTFSLQERLALVIASAGTVRLDERYLDRL